MMARRSSPPLDGFVPRPDVWDLVIKVKYGDTLKRFNAYVNGSHCDQNLAALRSKIANAFKFSAGTDFILTYTDEDGDIVMLDEDDDLCDAAIHQKLNPLRISVRLKSSSDEASQAKKQASNSLPSRSAALKDQLAQVRSVIDEALKAIPEPLPNAVAKLSHDLLSRATLSAPALTELLDQFAKLMTPNSNTQPSNRNNTPPSNMPTSGPSGSSGGEPETSVNLKDNHEPKLTVSASQSSDMQTSESSKTLGLKSVLLEDSAAPRTKTPQVDQTPGYPSIEESLISASSGGKKSDHKGSGDAQSKGKSIMPFAAPPVATIFHGVPTVCSAPAPSIGERSRTYEPKLSPSYLPFEANGKISSDLPSTLPALPSCTYSPVGLNVPSPHIPYPDRLLSSWNPYIDLSDNHESIPPQTFHRWIQCDGCGVQPIVGTRYKSNVKDDYDLCSTCFAHMGNEAEYSRIDRPSLRDIIQNQRLHSQRSNSEKLESCFIVDVTVLDGTLMAPSTPFTKVWLMRNNGSTMWPFGTQLMWVSGDQFAQQSSVQLKISPNGFPVDQEISVAVNFVAPASPGRYISYWRLASPSGQKFGQCVWVLIQVEQPAYTNGNKQMAAINLNLPPENSSTNAKHSIDVNAEPIDPIFDEFVGSTNAELLEPLIFIEPEEYRPSPIVLPPVPAAVPPAQGAIADPPSSIATTAISVPFVVCQPEPMPLLKPVDVPAPASAPTGVGAPAPVNVDNHREEKLLRELEEMGFKQVDLNKEILRQNKYDLEQSIDDLCGFNEWDPLLAELHEMGFDDTETNKEALAKNGGSVKRAAMDLIAREKKDQ